MRTRAQKSLAPLDLILHILTMKEVMAMQSRRERARECRVTVGSVTEAMRARSVLASVGVRAEVIKLDKAERGGCAYALIYPCTEDLTVRRALREAGIRARQGRGEK